MLIFNNWHVPFLIFSVHPLKKVNQKLYTIRTWLLSNWSLLLNYMCLELGTNTPKYLTYCQKGLSLIMPTS